MVKKKTFTSEYIQKDKKLLITLPLENEFGKEFVLQVNDINFNEILSLEKYLMEGIK